MKLVDQVNKLNEKAPQFKAATGVDEMELARFVNKQLDKMGDAIGKKFRGMNKSLATHTSRIVKDLMKS